MYIPGTTRLHIPLAHPSCAYYYLLSPNILVLHILFVLHFLFYCTFYSLFLFFTYIYALVLCYFYIIFIFILLHCPLSRPDLIYISLLIIPCIIYYVTNKQTLNLEHLKLVGWLAKLTLRPRQSNGAFPLHGTVRFGTARYGTVRYGSVRVGLRFHRSLVPL